MSRSDRRRTPRLALAAALLLAAPLAAQEADRPARPNVVLIMTDDQGYGDLACHGNPIIRTPNIDALHAESVRLTDFHVDPTCSPTRSALMTGRYSDRVGVWHTIMGRSILRSGEVTMADAFRRAGYATAIFGKWHLGDNYPSRPWDRGFDVSFIHGGGGVGQTPDYWGNDYFDDTYLLDGRPRPTAGYCTDTWFDAALDFIADQTDAGRPFFCYLPTNAAHGPYCVPKSYEQMYAGNSGVPNAAFYGMITNIDENVGRLLEALAARGLDRDTIVVFMTDNGTAAGVRGEVGYNAGMRGQKGSPYDGGHRVPCFIRWPGDGIEGGRDVDVLTAHIDLFPTLLDLCGIDPPDGVAFDGTSLSPLLRREQAEWPARSLVVESQRIEFPEKWRQCSVMTDRWRLVNGRELYDIEADPGQRDDVASEHPEVVERLRSVYESWWSDVSAGHGEYARIVLGSEAEDPSRLTCHDWHESDPPWNQSMIRDGKVANGFWAVEVDRDGTYEIALRRWPPEAPRPINDGPGPVAATARLAIGDVDETRAVDDEADAVTFRVPLDAGPARLQTWFTADDGRSRGAYYVEVRRVGD